MSITLGEELDDLQLIVEANHLTDFAPADPHKPTVVHVVVNAVLAFAAFGVELDRSPLLLTDYPLHHRLGPRGETLVKRFVYFLDVFLLAVVGTGGR